MRGVRIGQIAYLNAHILGISYPVCGAVGKPIDGFSLEDRNNFEGLITLPVTYVRPGT
jgi:hypothetical protein